MRRALQFPSRVLPGGHLAALHGQRDEHRAFYDMETLNVDEDSWFPCFRKDRWFGSIATDMMLTGNLWSVDDPAVWKELRIILELANRILNALIKDRHEL